MALGCSFASLMSEVDPIVRSTSDRALHFRESTVAESPQREIYQALGISGTPGGIHKTIIEPHKKIPETG